MIKNVYEILEEFSQATTKEAKITVLKNNATPHFLQVLKYTYDPQYEFYIKEFPKNYIKPDTLPGIRYSGIESDLRKIYLFQKGNPTADILTEEKRNQLLVELLESFEPNEAQVFINIMKKNLKINGLTYKLIKETFPTILP